MISNPKIFITTHELVETLIYEAFIGYGDTLNLEVLNAKQIHLKEEDIGSIVDIERHPRVREWLYEYGNSDAQKELRDYQEFFRKLPTNGRVDILVAKCLGRTVGFLGLWRLGVYMEHVATIGVSVHPDYWGKGVATQLIKSAIELARKKGIRRVEIETLVKNVSMRRVTERSGFKLESVRKERIHKDGVYHDEVSYSMLL